MEPVENNQLEVKTNAVCEDRCPLPVPSESRARGARLVTSRFFSNSADVRLMFDRKNKLLWEEPSERLAGESTEARL